MWNKMVQIAQWYTLEYVKHTFMDAPHQYSLPQLIQLLHETKTEHLNIQDHH